MELSNPSEKHKETKRVLIPHDAMLECIATSKPDMLQPLEHIREHSTIFNDEMCQVYDHSSQNKEQTQQILLQ